MKIKNIKILNKTEDMYDIKVENYHNYFITKNNINVHNSGKSYVADRVTGGHGLKLVNSDVAFEKMLKDAGMNLTPDDIFSDKGQDIRGQAKDITKKRKTNYIRGRLGLIIDGTGKDYNKIKRQSDELKKLGYDTSMIFVNTSLGVALERNRMRARQLKDDVVEKMWEGVQNNIGKFQSYFGSNDFIVVDNNNAGEDVFNKIWKYVMKLVKKKPDNYIAKKWIEQELEKKRR